MNRQYARPLTAVLGGAAALVLRLLQNNTGFEADTGLPIPGNLAELALAVLLIALAAGLLGSSCLLPREEEEDSPALPRDFTTTSTALLTLPVAGVFLMALGGLADLAECFRLLPEGLGFSRHELYRILRDGGLGFSSRGQLLMGVLALTAAAILFLMAAGCRRREKELGRMLPPTLTLFPVAAMVVRLVLVYRVDSVNPSLTMYYLELLALVFLTLGFYRLSSFSFQAGQTRRFGLYASAAVVLSAASLADGSIYLSSLLLNTGGAITLLGFLLLRIANGIEAEEDDGTIIGPAE